MDVVVKKSISRRIECTSRYCVYFSTLPHFYVPVEHYWLQYDWKAFVLSVVYSLMSDSPHERRSIRELADASEILKNDWYRRRSTTQTTVLQLPKGKGIADVSWAATAGSVNQLQLSLPPGFQKARLWQNPVRVHFLFFNHSLAYSDWWFFNQLLKCVCEERVVLFCLFCFFSLCVDLTNTPPHHGLRGFLEAYSIWNILRE
jgi:hypothetical protein